MGLAFRHQRPVSAAAGVRRRAVYHAAMEMISPRLAGQTEGPAEAQDNAYYRSIYLEAPLGMARISLEGILLDVNPSLCALLGYESEQLIGRHFSDFFCDQDLSSSQEWLRRLNVLETNRIFVEKRCRHAAGHALWISISMASWPGPSGWPQYFIVNFENISEHKALRQELSRNEEKYRTVLAATAQGFCMMDFSGHLLEVNDAYCVMTGYSREELLGMNVAELDAYENPASIGARIADVRRLGNLSFVACQRRKDGSIISLQIATTHVAVLGDRLFSFCNDLSEQQATVEELYRLQQSNVKSQQLNDEVHGMLVHISETTLRQVGQELHDDVGQILTGAAMLAGTMAATLAKADRAESGLARQLAGLLNEAVDKLRGISHGLFPVDLEPAGLHAMLESLVKQVRASTAIDARLQHDQSQPQLSAEQSLHIYRIVQEATSNVIRHSGAKLMTIAFAIRSRGLVISVTDNGFGIQRDRRNRPGAGIGLRTMVARAGQIGASLRTLTPPGGGTRIEILLPLATEMPASATPEE